MGVNGDRNGGSGMRWEHCAQKLRTKCAPFLCGANSICQESVAIASHRPHTGLVSLQGLARRILRLALSELVLASLTFCFHMVHLGFSNYQVTVVNLVHFCFSLHSIIKVLITESQNHRMVGVGRDLCMSSSPTPLPSRDSYSRLHRTLSRWVLNISREGDSTTSLGSLFQCSVTLRGKNFFLMFRRNFLCLSLCPLPLVLSLGTTEKSLAPSSWHPPLRYL